MADDTRQSVVLTRREGPALWITIHREERRNALNPQVLAQIEQAVRSAREDREVRVMVLTGAGQRAFCAGADLSRGTGVFSDGLDEPTTDFGRLARVVRETGIPLVARVNGDCVAGGMALMSLCDLAVVADHARFGLPEGKVGVFPMQVLSLLQNLVPRRLVREWALTGEPIGAQEALEAGLVNYVVPTAELDAKTDWLLSRLVDKSPTAIRRGKYAMRAIEAMSFDQAIAYTESQIALVAMTEDAKEGLAAFNERRKPVWTGR